MEYKRWYEAAGKIKAETGIQLEKGKFSIEKN